MIEDQEGAGLALIYDCFSGISGDMHIGAMLDLGVPEDLLRDQLGRLPVADEFTLRVSSGAKRGINGTQATICVADGPKPHRRLRDITGIIDGAGYAPPVRDRAIAIFGHLAHAEAKVHGVSVEEVHFHEVGATDAIADIVAAAICLDHLDVRDVFVTEVELGGGMVRCAHGLMPVPAPATAEIVAGLPCRLGGVGSETTTPTGAAILKHAVSRDGLPVGFRPAKVGYGLGQKDFDIPNVLRIMLGHRPRQKADDTYLTSQAIEIQCNIDDMAPEAFEPLIAMLFRKGARDVFMTPVIMKKSRPGVRLTVLCDDSGKPELLETIFRHSSTIGVRTHVVEKYMLPRELLKVSTSLGDVDVKRVTTPGGGSRWKLEHDVVAALARAHDTDYLSVYRRLEQEVAWQLDPENGKLR